MPICFSLLAHFVCNAFDLARARAGNRSAARMEIMAMTTRSSIRVKPRCLGMLRSVESARLLWRPVALRAEPVTADWFLVSPGMRRQWQNEQGGQRPSSAGFRPGLFAGGRVV